MPPFFASAANVLGSGASVEKILLSVNGSAVAWALGFTFAWDFVDLWFRGRNCKFLRTQEFWIYLTFHEGVSIVATVFLARALNTEWFVGLMAAVSNEMVLSNANITFGNATLLPLLDKFRELRAAMQKKVDDISKTRRRELIEKLAQRSPAELEGKLMTLYVQQGRKPADIAKELAELRAACAGNDGLLAKKLANDFIELDPEGAQAAALESLRATSRTGDVAATPL